MKILLGIVFLLSQLFTIAQTNSVDIKEISIVTSKPFQSEGKISKEALKSFEETFPQAQNVKWTELDEHSSVFFTQNNITVRAYYDIDGNLLTTIRYYDPSFLPPYILSKLKKKYAGKEVYYVTELTSNDEMMYYISLRDKKYWYKIEADANGHMERVEKFINAGTD